MCPLSKLILVFLFSFGSSASFASSLTGKYTILCKQKDGCFKSVNFFSKEKAEAHLQKNKNCADPNKKPDEQPNQPKDGKDNGNVR